MSDFGIFWAHYPKRVAKKDAEKAWKKLTSEQKQKAMEALPKHVEFWAESEFIPHPATWLNGERWEDELPEKRQPLKIVVTDAWWTSNEGVERRGSELGVYARRGESYADYKSRVIEADKMTRAIRAA